MTHHIRRYDSVQEAVTAAENVSDEQGSSHVRGNDSWAGGSWKKCLGYAREGWSDVRPDVDAILEPVRERLATILSDHPDRYHDICGFEPDIDRYIAGELECMYDEIVQPQIKTGKVFTVLINGTYNCMVAKETILARGAAICALVEALQILGCDLNIWVENSVRGGRGSAQEFTVLTKVHDAGQILDINNVMFPIGHSGWLRRIVFGIQEGEPTDIRKTFGFGTQYGGYGYPTDTCLMDDEIEPSMIMLLSESHRHQDVTDPVGWVLAQLEAQGVWSPPDLG